VNFSARTVISPDSNIGVDEVGVPEEIAKILTMPVYATDENIQWLKEMVLAGPDAQTGANYVIDNEHNRLRITAFNRENLAEQVQPGWIIERHISDGDIVLLNRQPTLHRLSIMAHKVRVLPGRTFRINPSVCPPYNADFDGDEMNLHVPQGEEARAEALYLLGISRNLRSPRFGAVVIGGWRSQLCGSMLLTLNETKISHEDAVQLLFNAEIEVDLPKKKEFSGKEIFSYILPPDMNMKFASKAGKSGKLDKSESEVVIENGKLLKGVIDDNAVGAFGGVILDKMVQDYGPDEALVFLNKFIRLSLRYLSMRQLSIGIDDLTISSETHDEIKNAVDVAESDVSDMITQYQKGKLDVWPGMTPGETLESNIVNRLNKTRDEAVKMVTRNLSMPNAAVVMAISGARGKLLNVGLMAGLVGQQAIGGGRPKRGYYSNRTFPHFKEGDLGTRSKGFISSSYSAGLDPFEFFWVSASGREGLADTGVKTPKSGYMYRRLSNALQDLRIERDLSVRDASGVIVQFMYGEDGIDVNKSDFGTLDLDKIVEGIEDASKKAK
jgi:DNA-directed RNA polymerase subunit A'